MGTRQSAKTWKRVAIDGSARADASAAKIEKVEVGGSMHTDARRIKTWNGAALER